MLMLMALGFSPVVSSCGLLWAGAGKGLSSLPGSGLCMAAGWRQATQPEEVSVWGGITLTLHSPWLE